jgi:hypothetical protein
MKCIEFVEKLQALAPSPGFFEARGYTEEQVEMSLGEYFLEPIDDFHEYGDECLNLVKNFDVGLMSLGFYQFETGSEIRLQIFEIASMESSKLVLDRADGKIKEYLTDDGWDYYFHRNVAISGAHFLDCLILLLEVFKDRTIGVVHRQDDVVNRICAEACEKASMVNGTMDFYLGVLGGGQG